jgi:hypothetical protein
MGTAAGCPAGTRAIGGLVRLDMAQALAPAAGLALVPAAALALIRAAGLAARAMAAMADPAALAALAALAGLAVDLAGPAVVLAGPAVVLAVLADTAPLAATTGHHRGATPTRATPTVTSAEKLSCGRPRDRGCGRGAARAAAR